jgi:hypothetical protein
MNAVCVVRSMRFNVFGVVSGSCGSKHALGWSLSYGQLQFDQGNTRSSSRSQCLARKSDNSAGMMHCVDGFEYITMELPAAYS